MQALVVYCSSCGGAIPLKSNDPKVTCVFCGNEQVISPELLQELAGYQQKVEAHLEGARQDRAYAASVERVVESSKKRKVLWKVIIYAWLLGLPLLIIFAAAFLAQSGILPRFVQDRLGQLVGVALLLPLLIAGFVWFFSGKKTAPGVSIPEPSMTCPNCGLVLFHEAGKATDRCSHCDAILVPPKPVREQVTEEAQELHRGARVQRIRQERESYSMVAALHAGSFTAYMALGSIGLFMVPSTILMTLHADETVPPWGMLVMWGATFFIIGGLVGLPLWRWRWRLRWAGAMARLAAECDGEAGRGHVGAVAWLNRYWTGELASTYITPGMYYGHIAFSVKGFPMLLIVDPKTVTDELNDGCSVLLLLAAQIPGATEGGDPAAPAPAPPEALQRKLTDRGLSVSVQEAGLLAEAEHSVAQRLRWHPEEILSLRRWARLLAKVASALQASPAQPMD